MSYLRKSHYSAIREFVGDCHSRVVSLSELFAGLVSRERFPQNVEIEHATKTAIWMTDSP